MRKFYLYMLFTLAVAMPWLNGCIREDRDDCKGRVMLRFRYVGDGTTDIFPDKIEKVTVYVYSADNGALVGVSEYDKTAKWTLFDLQAKLQQSGWMVPAYTMPKNIEQVVVMRIVARQGMSRDMADMLLGDIRNAVAEFEQLAYPTTSRLKYERREKQMGKVYTH